jgi:LmbE family N-acetylglucosaminyl deacetylase
MTETPTSALVVTPHPDDAEGGCGATMAKWIAESGTHVVVLMSTNGNKGTGDRAMTPDRLAATREAEQREASRMLGVDEVVFLRYGDGELEDTVKYRGEVVREIRRHKPEVVFCIDPYRVTSHTHRDHRKSGQVALDAAYSYAWSYLDYPEQFAGGLEPHRVREALLWGSERPDTFIEVTEEQVRMKAESLLAHASQMGPRTPEIRLERFTVGARNQGERIGVELAEGFRRIEFNLGSEEWWLLNR